MFSKKVLVTKIDTTEWIDTRHMEDNVDELQFRYNGRQSFHTSSLDLRAGCDVREMDTVPADLYNMYFSR